MICLHCHYDNTKNAKFCKKCGTSLTLAANPIDLPRPEPIPEPTHQLNPESMPYEISTNESVSDKLDRISELLNDVIGIQAKLLKEKDSQLEEKDMQLKESAQKIAELKNILPKEYVCPSCHKVYSSLVKFCSECGTQM